MKSIPAESAWLNQPNLPTPVQVIISMYQMLILSRNGKIYGNAWESDLKQER
jgi:hypothetical protein